MKNLKKKSNISNNLCYVWFLKIFEGKCKKKNIIGMKSRMKEKNKKIIRFDLGRVWVNNLIKHLFYKSLLD